jgi:hypothetical protein
MKVRIKVTSSTLRIVVTLAGIGGSELACGSGPRISNVDHGSRSPVVRARGRRYGHLITPICDKPNKRHLEHSCWPVEPASGGHFVTVSASCGITDQGSVECWKAGLASPPTGRYETIDDNGRNACATRSDGGVGCWGRAPWPSVPSSPRFTAIAAGGSGNGNLPSEGINACGLTDAGDIECWGDGTPHWTGKLQLKGPFRSVDIGSGDVVALRATGEIDSFIGPDVTDKYTQTGPYSLLSANGHVDCQLLVSGRVECQGGLRKAAESPPAELSDVRLLRTGSDHACALLANGDLRCWGDARPPPRLKFSYVSQPDIWDSYCGITVDGRAYCWGNASAGS